jgi:hypothetical protein
MTILHYQMLQMCYVHNTNMWGYFWLQSGCLTTPGWPYIGIAPHCLANNSKEIFACFVLNVFCDYFILWKGPNWGVINKIPIFGVIFGQNWDIWTPGVTRCRDILHCLALNFKEIVYCFGLNVFLSIFGIFERCKMA